MRFWERRNSEAIKSFREDQTRINKQILGCIANLEQSIIALEQSGQAARILTLETELLRNEERFDIIVDKLKEFENERTVDRNSEHAAR